MQPQPWSPRTPFTPFLFSSTSFSCCPSASRWSSSSSPSAQVRLPSLTKRRRPAELLCHVSFFFEALQPEEQLPSASGLPNELLLSLLHHSLEHELNDREIPLAYSDHGAFMLHILERERDGNVAPFSLPVIKGQHISQPLWGRLSHVCRLSVSTEECAKPADRQDTMTSFHTSCSSKEVMGSTSTLQVTTPSFKTKQTLATSLRQSSQQQSMKNFYGSRFEIPTLTTDFSNGRALATRILWTRSPSLGREAALFHSGGATLSSSAASRFSSLFSQRPSQVRSAVCVRPPSAQV